MSFGGSPDIFGRRDYSGNLLKIWDAYAPGKDRQQRLMAERQRLLDWMGTPEGESKMHARNYVGVQDGLAKTVSDTAFTREFMGQNMEMNPDTGHAYSKESENWFGLPDLAHARAMGKSWGDIKAHLDANPGWLRDKNVPGGGGLYDQIIRPQADFEQREDTWTSGLKDLSTEFGNLANTTTQHHQDIKEFNQKQLDWQTTESAAQRAHEAAMLAEAKKVKTATPTHVKNPVSQLAIGPGKVAAPQSASSLARKRLGSAPLVTGLNIGTKKTSMNIK